MNDYVHKEQRLTVDVFLSSPYIHHKRVAVDGGANAGLWTVPMARVFNRVEAFEPHWLAREMLFKNIAGMDNVCIYKSALSDRSHKANLITRRGTRGSYLQYDADGAIAAMPLDSYYLDNCDFIKLDVEGAEFDALIGGLETIKRCRPVIAVEIKNKLLMRYGHSAKEINKLFSSLGYVMVMGRWCDYLYAPKEALDV